MATCPNTSHPDWKSLVEEKGLIGANLAYVKNGFDIPRRDNLKEAPEKTIITTKTGLGGRLFNFSNTIDSMLNHPEKATEMIDELKNLYPEIRVFKDRIIDENGNYLEIPANKQGRHYRNAFLSAVAWTNDSAMETPPHEYAHEYIDMYREHPLVSRAIKKYGEERLVTLIGRKYAGQKMSNSFEKFINDFWKMIRRTFGAPSMVDILTDSFAKNEILGDQFHRGTEAVHNFQDASSPKLGKDTVMNFDKDTESASAPINIATKEETIGSINKELFSEQDYDKSPTDMIPKFREWWGGKNGLVKRAKMATRMDTGGSTEFSNMSNSQSNVINNAIINNENIEAILSKIRGEDIKLNSEQEIALNSLINVFKGTVYKESIANVSYLNTDVNNPTAISENIINEKGLTEIVETFAKKAARLAKKNKIFQALDKFLTKQLKHVTNARLWTKYISGGENSIISRVLYKGLNDGREKFSGYSGTSGFSGFFTSNPSSYYDGSTFHNKDASINELETETFELDKRFNSLISEDSIELTKAEILMIYLTGRQKGGMNNLKEGFTLNTIKDRKVDSDNKYKLTDEQLKGIVESIEKDPQAQEIVSEIDNAMNYSHKELNATYRLLEGFDLEKIDNYFPMFHGKENTRMRKSKNVIIDMRNLRLRSSDGMAVRLTDPFQALSSLKMSNAAYIGYAIPIHNAEMMLNKIKSKKLMHDDMGDFIKSLDDLINRVQDNSLLYSTQGDQQRGQLVNKITGNFAVALLAYNPGVIFKQSVSLITAQSAIDESYIRRSGANLGIVSVINPIDLFKRLTLSGDKTMLPIEWEQMTDNPIYKTLIKYPLFRDRFEGMVSRETGEAVMGRQIQGDMVSLPFVKGKDGKPVKISKSRLMSGITMMDSLTIMRLYSAVELETQDRMNEAKFKNLTEEQIETHNINRLQEIIDKTQPTFDQTNRSGLAASTNPIYRVLTMFSSATQKIAEQSIDAIIDYNQNPSKETLLKLGKRSFETLVLTSVMLTTIDILWAMAKGGWDDDDFDSIPEAYALGTVKSSLGSLHGVGQFVSVVTSQLDSKPWSQEIQNPFISIVQEGAEATANAAKGNYLKALKSSLNATFKATGIPVTPLNTSVNYANKLMGEK